MSSPRRCRALTRERFFESVLQSISDRVCILDRNGVAIYTNCRAETFAVSSPDPLHQEQFSTEVQYPSPSEPYSHAVLMNVESMPQEYGGVIIRWLDFAFPNGEVRAGTDRSLDLLANSAPVMMWRSGADKGCTYFKKKLA